MLENTLENNLETKKLPTIWDAIIVIVVTLALMLTVGAYLAYKIGFWGNVTLQFFAIAVPLVYIKIRKLDLKAIFPIKKPKVRHIFGATCLWLGTLILMIIVSLPLQKFFPNSVEGINELNELFSSQSFITLTIAVALFPAICEEFMFRGFVFSGFKSKFSPMIAIIITSLLFGAFHMNLIRLITTAMLGISINYALFKTKNMVIPCYIHFVNNLFSMSLLKLSSVAQNMGMDKTPTDPAEALSQIPPSALIFALVFYVVVGTGFLLLGIYFLSKKDKVRSVD